MNKHRFAPIYEILAPKAEHHANGSKMLGRVAALEPFLYFGRFGSRLYGTAIADSDDDFRGVFVPSAEDLLLCKAKSGDTISSRGQDRKSGPNDFDTEFFSLQTYLMGLAEGQTFALDMLFTPEGDIIQAGQVWRAIQRSSHVLVNSKCEAAVEYARSQANRYSTRGDRIAACKTVMEIFEHDAVFFGKERLRDSVADIKFRDWLAGHPEMHEHVRFVEKTNAKTGKVFEYLEVCGKQADMNGAIGLAYQMFKGKLDEYGYRARQAYDAGGADWKALYHAIRVGEQTIELLQTGHITFPRPEAPRLLKIRRGEVPIEVIYNQIDELLERVKAAQAVSTLRPESDMGWIRDFIIGVNGAGVYDWLKNEGICG